MTFKGIVDFVLEEAGYFVVMAVVYLTLRNFMKSKIGNALISIATGAALYFFLNDPGRILDALGEIVAKLFIN